MTIGRRWLSWWAAAMVLFALPLAAFAQEVPQNIPGSIELTVCRGEEPVPGGEMTCIRVGAVWEDDGNYSFRRLDGQALTDIQSPELAAELEKFAKDNQLTGMTLPIGDEGKVIFPDLEIGLYLLMQETAAPGYTRLDPFLVSVPYLTEGKYQYNVTPLVKGELERETETEPPETEPPETEPPTTEPTETEPRETESKLPQTGQLNWPVPVLAVLGLLLFSAGWALRFGKKKGSYEK